MRHLAAVLIALALPAAAVAATTTPADTKPPTVKVTGLPAGSACVKTTSKLSFDIRDASGLKRVYVFIDGDLAGHSVGNAALKIKFPHALAAGRHRLGVLARDTAGNLARRVVHFRVCG